jgi:5,10-methylene-tetrahydrofolate dehydrogenase/methenyl tetrahydrofolate cyclohydrolase
VVDVGTDVLADGSLVGGTDQEPVSTVASALSPYPEGSAP